ncbi:MAG: hypothetical protein HQL46_09285 [Gammaproteobacteria bacterium]|nr:hypothetical protein [Gammaproteobacteria bacterium]
MKISTFSTILILVLTSCSTETLKRVGYETINNFGQYQCNIAQGDDCHNRESYDDYQRKREELYSK